MTFLLPAADGVADEVARRLPRATIARYEDGGHDLGEVDFYCLPYMGNGASVAMIAKMPRLRVLQSLSSGVDNLMDSVPEQVTLCNGSGLHHEESTAELAVCLILASLRQLPRFARDQARRRWQHVRTDSLDGKKVLLVGYGGMGRPSRSGSRRSAPGSPGAPTPHGTAWHRCPSFPGSPPARTSSSCASRWRRAPSA